MYDILGEERIYGVFAMGVVTEFFTFLEGVSEAGV
jgi:hypothetical protein